MVFVVSEKLNILSFSHINLYSRYIPLISKNKFYLKDCVETCAMFQAILSLLILFITLSYTEFDLVILLFIVDLFFFFSGNFWVFSPSSEWACCIGRQIDVVLLCV